MKVGAGGAAMVVAGCATGVGASGDGIRNVRAESPELQAHKRAALEAAKELGPTMTDVEVRRTRNIPGKRAAFYLDDVIFLFRDLARERPKSCWDHFLLAAFKEAHEKYGLKAQFNVFYRNDFYYGARGAEFTLRDMPDTWKAEFQAAKDWFRFGFHSYSEFPDYPWINASYEELRKLLTEKYESVMDSRYFGHGGIEIVLAGKQLEDSELDDLVRLSYNLS